MEKSSRQRALQKLWGRKELPWPIWEAERPVWLEQLTKQSSTRWVPLGPNHRGHHKELGLYSQWDGKPLEGFEQRRHGIWFELSFILWKDLHKWSLAQRQNGLSHIRQNLGRQRKFGSIVAKKVWRVLFNGTKLISWYDLTKKDSFFSLLIAGRFDNFPWVSQSLGEWGSYWSLLPLNVLFTKLIASNCLQQSSERWQKAEIRHFLS